MYCGVFDDLPETSWYVMAMYLLLWLGVFGLCVSGQTQGDIRLVGNEDGGRLEIYYNSTWGTVCDDAFTEVDATVVCRQLYNELDNIYITHYTAGGGSGVIWLDNVRCIGTESRLDNCSHIGWGKHDCVHHEDVGVKCIELNAARLVDGNSSDDGRLEIYYNGTWGTVCDNHFAYREAIVACNQLQKGTDYVEYYRIGGGTGTIWLNNLDCFSTERGLELCPHDGWGIHDCTHDQDVGIRCYANHTGNVGDVRLVYGTKPGEGVLEIYYNSIWGRICYGSFTYMNAIVACRQLHNRFSYGLHHPDSSSTTQIWLDEIQCNGTESRLEQCSHDKWGHSFCDPNQRVKLFCLEFNEVRLSDTNNGGRLEVYHNGTWGSVRIHNFLHRDAVVICRQFGHGTDNVEYYKVEGGFGNTWSSTLKCTGEEKGIQLCQGFSFEESNTTHAEDVGIRCDAGNFPDGELRLVDGSDKDEGRIEIYHNGKWGTVCDDFFNSLAAVVVCLQLHYRITDVSYYTAGGGFGTIWMDNVVCSGLTSNLQNCSYRGWGIHNCGHHEDVGVRCKGEYVGSKILKQKFMMEDRPILMTLLDCLRLEILAYNGRIQKRASSQAGIHPESVKCHLHTGKNCSMYHQLFYALSPQYSLTICLKLQHIAGKCKEIKDLVSPMYNKKVTILTDS